MPQRIFTVQPQQQQLALQAAREREKTDAFKRQFSRRAGIEDTICLGVRSFDMRRTHYMGLAKTHLQHILIAYGMTLMSLSRWLSGETPAQRRPNAFARLYKASFA